MKTGLDKNMPRKKSFAAGKEKSDKKIAGGIKKMFRRKTAD